MTVLYVEYTTVPYVEYGRDCPLIRDSRLKILLYQGLANLSVLYVEYRTVSGLEDSRECQLIRGQWAIKP